MRHQTAAEKEEDDMSATERQLKKALLKAKRLPFNNKSKFILMSDCHRGQGNTADDFLRNQSLFFGALDYYYNNGFTYIELGDGDELWANRQIAPIVQTHDDAYWQMSRFYDDGRFYMIYGNHDAVKKRKKYKVKGCDGFYCDVRDAKKEKLRIFPCLKIEESIVLDSTELQRKILLVHGHQGSFLNDRCWMLARFLVRYFWRPLEMVGFRAPTGAARSHAKKEILEKQMARFAETESIMLVAGHTHRPVFPKPGESLYFNDGSCVHPRCITGIEIENNQISLVKWAVRVGLGEALYVKRSVLEGPVEIEEFFEGR